MGPRMDNEKSDIRVTLEEGAFALWVLRQYQRVTGKGQRSALDFIIERWAVLEPSAATYGITLEQFATEAALAKVSPLRKAERGTSR
jgi:hypothetical protein